MNGTLQRRLGESAVLAVLLITVASGSAAQERPGTETGTIRGVALDSTTMAPLAGAVVSVAGGGGELRADADGVFRFENVPPGDYPIIVDHPRLDSLGLTPMLRLVTVEPGSDQTVVFSTPSVATFRQMHCDAGVPVDGDRDGIVIGAVQDRLTGVGQPQAVVVAEWPGPAGERQTSTASTDGAGVFVFCDLPRDLPVRMLAQLFGEEEGETVVDLGGGGILVHDLEVRLTRPGSVVGKVIDQDTGEPIEAAIVRISGTDLEAVTGRTGRFRFETVPPGRQLLEMEHLAYGTQSRELDVGSETLDVTARFTKGAILLEGITVTVRPARLERLGYFERRQRLDAFATFMETEEIVKRSPVRLSTAVSTLMGVELRYEQGGPYLISTRQRRGIDNAACRLRLIVDGMAHGTTGGGIGGAGWSMNSVNPDEIQAIELYPSDLSMPEQYKHIGGMDRCGALVIWTGR